MSDQKRYNEGKPQLHYLLTFRMAAEGLARVMEYGGKKYEPYNYKKGCKFSQCLDSGLRHLTAFLDGEDIDPESNLPHVDLALFNFLQLSQMYHTRPDNDDRPHKVIDGTISTR